MASDIMSISSSDIMPLAPSMPSMPSDPAGSMSQSSSQVFIWSISGPWAALICSARAITVGSSPLAITSSDIWMACSWCGTMPCTKATSASFTSSGSSAVAVCPRVVVAPELPVVPSSLLHAAAVVTSATARIATLNARRICRDVMWSPHCSVSSGGVRERARSHRGRSAAEDAQRREVRRSGCRRRSRSHPSRSDEAPKD